MLLYAIMSEKGGGRVGFEIINVLKKKKGLTNAQIAKMSGITISTLDKITSGVNTNPKLDTLQAICKVLGCTLDDFSDSTSKEKNAQLYSSEAMKLAKDYDGLDGHGKRVVRLVADEELARCAENAHTAPARGPNETVYYITSWFYHPMSAGTGEQAEGDQPESLRLIKEPPRGTSYVAPVHGDSMEPTYHDGDNLFIHACEEIEPGQIGVFYMDGQQWVKELGDGELISHNPDYPPRPMTEDIRCQGLVLGVCDGSYFE